MSAASFAITYDELRVIIASDRGFSLDPKRWNEKQQYVVNDVLTSGIAQVYFPPAIDGEKVAPDWTFLKPLSTITLKSGLNQIKLPDDFGNFDGPISVKPTSSVSSPWFIDWLNQGKILQMFAETPLITGPPRFASEIALRGPAEPQGQRKALMVYPSADQDYDLQVIYSIAPSRLSGSQPFAYGGPQYRELYIASCLAVGEQRFDNRRGVHTQRFEEMLIMAISQDNKNRPQKLGYNANREAQPWRGWRHRPTSFSYNGEPFT